MKKCNSEFDIINNYDLIKECGNIRLSTDCKLYIVRKSEPRDTVSVYIIQDSDNEVIKVIEFIVKCDDYDYSFYFPEEDGTNHLNLVSVRDMIVILNEVLVFSEEVSIDTKDFNF